MTQSPLVVTATAPTPNGPLHVGHLAGPFIAADVAARAARSRGARVLTVSGLDPHQNYVRAKAASQGRTADEVLDTYEALVRRALRAARISYDVYIDPRADRGYRDRVARLLGELAGTGAVVTEPATLTRCGDCGTTLHHAYVSGDCPRCGLQSSGGTCEACGAFTTAENLGDPRCARCGGAPEPFTERIPLLRLESCRAALAEAWSAAVMPARVRSLAGHYLARGLPDVPLAYPTDWGVPAGDGGQRVDVWVEMGLGLLSETARRLDPDASTLEGYLTAWRRAGRRWHFLGIDNAFYFAVLFPGLFTAAGLDPAGPGGLGGLVVNEFYLLDGLKFSTSRGHAVWAHEFLADEDPALVRLYLCWDRPDRYESVFTRDAYAEFRDWAKTRLRAGGTLPDGLAAAEARRAARALELESFDPGLAARCLLGAG
ncbi:MAG: class I tRNA ligase family protein, partial [Nocardiopsaceae bacterium]|nr:class I tRNA ligase family protein [Nocardiopsaceae bacterium]